MNENGRYFSVHTKKGELLSRESDDENVMINLIDDSQYFLEDDDVLEEVDAKFVVERLKNRYTETKDMDAKKWNAFYFIIGTSITFLIAYGFHKQSTEISIFVIPFWLFLLLLLIDYKRKKKKEFQEIFENNYYSAFKRIR